MKEKQSTSLLMMSFPLINSPKIILPGSFVRLIDSDDFGEVVELIPRYGYDGARVLMTSKGEIFWSPLQCLEQLSEETDQSVDETSRLCK
jgi:hypothetical protein